MLQNVTAVLFVKKKKKKVLNYLMNAWTLCYATVCQVTGRGQIIWNICAQVLNAHNKDDRHQKLETGELAFIKMLIKNY